MSQYLADLRYGLRQLRLNPLFTAVAVLSLALGIGANIAIFELIDAIRMRPLPVGNPQQLGYLDFGKNSKRSGWWSTRSAVFTSKQFDSIQRQQQAFSGLIAWSAKPFDLSREGKARYKEGLFVSGDFFNLLQVPAAAGRVFTAQDDQPGCGSPAAVVGYPSGRANSAAIRRCSTGPSGWMGKCSRLSGWPPRDFSASKSGKGLTSRYRFARTFFLGAGQRRQKGRIPR